MKNTGKGKLIKRLAAVCLAAGMVLPMAFAAVGCEIIVKPDPNDPSKDFTVDIKPNNPSTPSTDPGEDKNPEPEQPTEPDYSMYSKTLQTVLTSDYYNDLIALMKTGHYKDPNKNYFDGGFNKAECIPYTFLKKQGENIQDILNDDIRVICSPYINDNDKNVLFNRVEITYDNDNNDYIKQYLIKYKITDQELEDLKMLYQGKYYQAQMFVQELDNQRDAELVSEFSIYESTYKGLLAEFNMAKVLTSIVGEIDNYTILRAVNDKKII